MGEFRERSGAFLNSGWLVLVASMWLMSCAGIGYLFGSITPVIKSSLAYNQREVARLGVAKDLGDSVGFLAGGLCEVLPLWAGLLVGALQNFVGCVLSYSLERMAKHGNPDNPEIIVRDCACPRPAAMAVTQLLIAVGHDFFAMGWPGAMYIGTLLIGLGYCAHWAIVPAAASELFGLKKFGVLYNFLTLANPLVLSSSLA